MRTIAALMCLVGIASPAAPQQVGQDKPVSWTKDIVPIFKSSCIKCHKPDKKKGKLDMSTYELLMKGGKQGSPIKPGDPVKSLLIEMVSGSEPEMPEDGDPLKPDQIALITRWIKEGAKEDK